MDTEKIAMQVAALVRQKLAAEQTNQARTPLPAKKPALILYESSVSLSHCGSCTVCAGADCPADLAPYRIVVLAALSCKALHHIASGAAETAFEQAAVNAFLTGKKILIVKEGTELLRFTHSAPALYYKNIDKNLEILLGSGARLVSTDSLCDSVKSACGECGRVQDGSILTFSKKMLSLSDAKYAAEKGYAGVRAEQKIIVSALAAEYAKEIGLEIIR